MSRNIVYCRKQISLCRALLIVGETRPTSKMSVTSVAGDAGVGERARRARHTVASSLRTDLLYLAHNFCDIHYIRTF